MMPGVQLEEIWTALNDAFEDLDALDLMLRLRLNKRRQNIVANGGMETVTFKLLEKAEAQGWDVDLIRAAHQHVPRNKPLAQIYQKYGLAPETTCQEAGDPKPSQPTTSAGFERTITDIQLLDMGLWREKLAKIEGRVCRVEVNGRGIGTGFLVGPDAVLTNYHVLKNVIDNRTPAAAVICRFDYKVLANNSPSTGVEVGLNLADWRIDHSPYTAGEAAGQPDRADPTVDELDYALVRLARPFGDEPLTATAPKRGWVWVPDAPQPFTAGMPLLIAQHPNAAPLKLALDTKAVIGLNANRTRVRYATNTEPGSSGSSCFNLTWDLVALHHYGDPAYGHPKFNQGIPITLIRDRLTRGNLATALGAKLD